MRTRSWVVLILVVLVLLVADVAAASATNRRAADAFVASQKLPVRPYVHVDNFPFFTQALVGHYGHVTFQANRATTLESDPITLHFLRLEMHGVRPKDGWKQATAERVEGSTRIGFGSIGKRLGQRVAYAGKGRLVATVKVQVGTRTLRPQVLAKPELRNGDIVFGDFAEQITNAVPPDVRRQLEQTFQRSIPLGSLPFGLTARKLRLSATDVVLQVSGRNLDLGSR